jgi:hypothetical protein
MQNVSSCRRTGPIDGQGCGLRFGLRVTRARPLGHVFGYYGAVCICNDDRHSPSRTKLVESALLAVEI